MQRLSAEDTETRSLNIVAENIERLKALFPEAFTEGKVDFAVLKQLLGGAVDDREEKYGLNWNGKRRARQLALTPSTGTLRPCPEDSVDWDTTQNLMIEGDNLEVLKLLQKSYAGKVKLIYIDPPYNTGNDFVYPDNYQDSIRNYLEITGQVDGNGQKLSSNTEDSGRFHTNWLNMMYPRLKLARDLLRKDGALFVSIDDNAVDNLRALCDAIFGDDAFVAQICVQSNKGGQDYLAIAKTHEYVVCYLKDAELDGLFELPKDTASLPFRDANGPYEIRELRNRNPKFDRGNRPNLYFPIWVNPELCDDNGYSAASLTRLPGYSVEALPRNSEGKDGCWRWGRAKVSGAIVANNPQDSDVVARRTRNGGWNVYEKSRRSTQKAKTIWDETEVRTEAGTREVRELFGTTVFDHPKPLFLIEKILRIGSEDGIVLDFFVGSGTTGHAVMALNSVDTGNRRYILVQLPEPLNPDSASQKAAADLCDQLGKPRTIAELTKERLRRAGQKIRDENPMFPGDLGFRVFKLDSSNIRAWDPDRQDIERTLLDSVEHLKADRSEGDILFEVLLKLGLELTAPIEQQTIAGKTVHSVGAGTLFACLAEQISREEAEALALGIARWHEALNPAGETTVIFRDSAFADDVAKTNVAAILQQHGLANVRSL